MHTLNLGCSVSTVRESCNNQRPRCDITWLHVTNHLYHFFLVKRLNSVTLRVRFFNYLTRKTRGINNTNTFNHSGGNVLITVSDLQSNLEYIKKNKKQKRKKNNKKQKIKTIRGYACPLTPLAWYRHFSKVK